MTIGRIEVVRLTPEDWECHRDLRLRALATDPQAFGATYADNAAYDQATWRARLAAVTYWQARADGMPLGMVGLWDPAGEVGAGEDLPDGAQAVPFLIAMFVLPATRHRGVARALLDAVVVEARSRGHRHLMLDVAAGNDAAVALYEGAGFRIADEREPPVGSGCQVGMVLALG